MEDHWEFVSDYPFVESCQYQQLKDDNHSKSSRLKRFVEKYKRDWTIKELKKKTLKDQNLSSPLVELTLDDDIQVGKKKSKCVVIRDIIKSWYKNNLRCIRSLGKALFPLDSNYQ